MAVNQGRLRHLERDRDDGLIEYSEADQGRKLWAVREEDDLAAKEVVI
jgi:hypothetical protein